MPSFFRSAPYTRTAPTRASTPMTAVETSLERAALLDWVAAAPVAAPVPVPVEDEDPPVERAMVVVADTVDELVPEAIVNWSDCAKSPLLVELTPRKLMRKPLPMGKPPEGGLKSTDSAVPLAGVNEAARVSEPDDSREEFEFTRTIWTGETSVVTDVHDTVFVPPLDQVSWSLGEVIWYAAAEATRARVAASLNMASKVGCGEEVVDDV